MKKVFILLLVVMLAPLVGRVLSDSEASALAAEQDDLGHHLFLPFQMVPSPMPNLVVASLTAEQQPDGFWKLEGRYCNAGDRDAVPTEDVWWGQLGGEVPWSPGEPPIRPLEFVVSPPALQPGECRVVTTLSPPDTYAAQLILDIYDDVRESNEDDNYLRIVFDP